MIKLVATDIDGTILIPEGEFTAEVKDCIKRLLEKEIKGVSVAYPKNYPLAHTADGNTLKMQFDKEYQAVIFEIIFVIGEMLKSISVTVIGKSFG